jgi:MFS family permease
VAPQAAGTAWRALHGITERVRRYLSVLASGGSWTYQLTPSVRDNLRWLWLDGFFSSASDSIVVSYLSLFVLALGATRAQVGLLSSLASLSAAILLFPGAAFVERHGKHKQMVVVSSSAARAMILLLALVPLVASARLLVAVAIGFAVLRSTFVNLSMPAWTPMTADLVPLRWRGRYFSARNIAMVVSGMLATLLVGQLITWISPPLGYQVAMGLAFLIGITASYSFSRIEEPSVPSVGKEAGSRAAPSLWSQLRASPEFLAFCVTSALWNFGLNIGGPFFSPYLVERLGASAGTVGVLSVVSSLAALPGHRFLGPLVDRWGPRRVQIVTGLAIPAVPLAWMLARSPWHVVPLNLVSGFLWAGYGVATFSLQLGLTPKEHRPRYTALYQVVVLGALAAGAAVGGAIVERWGYTGIFIATAAGRLIAALLRLIPPRRLSSLATENSASTPDG